MPAGESMESSLHEQNFPALLDAVHRIAEEAIESETLELRPTSPLDRAAVRWLSDEAELADGKMLLPAAVTTLTVLSHPSASQNADTAFGKRQCLLATGWTIAPSGRHASAKQKCLHGSQAEIILWPAAELPELGRAARRGRMVLAQPGQSLLPHVACGISSPGRRAGAVAKECHCFSVVP